MLYFGATLLSTWSLSSRDFLSNCRKDLPVIDNIEQTVTSSLDRLDRIGVRL